jgi:hypothetical protein
MNFSTETKPPLLSSQETLRPSILHFKYDNFTKLPSGVNRVVESEVQVDARGYKWQLELFPGGFYTHNAAPPTEDDQMMGFCICLCDTPNGANSVNAVISFSVRDAMGMVVKEVVWHLDQGSDFIFKKNTPTGGPFLKRSTILDESNSILFHGALLVDVCIQIVENPDLNAENLNMYFRPAVTNPLHSNMMKLHDSGHMSDVTFKVKGKIFNAHKLVIHANAPLLAQRFESEHFESERVVEHGVIEIEKMKPAVFRQILRYIYGGSLINDRKFIESHGIRMIRAAERFGMPTLKAAVETALVSYRIIDLKNAAEIILFSESMDCQNLKEYAVQYFIARPDDVLNSEFSEKRDELRSSNSLQQLMTALEMDKLSMVSKRGSFCNRGSFTRRGSLGDTSLGTSSVVDLTLSCLGKTLDMLSNSAATAMGNYAKVDSSDTKGWI